MIINFIVLCHLVMQRDVLVLDVDNKDATIGMSCPPMSFVDKEFLKCIHRILKPSGLFSFPASIYFCIHSFF